MPPPDKRSVTDRCAVPLAVSTRRWFSASEIMLMHLCGGVVCDCPRQVLIEHTEVLDRTDIGEVTVRVGVAPLKEESSE